MKTGVRIIGAAIAVAALALMWLNARQMEEMSRLVVSETTAQSKMRGTLVHQPFLADSAFEALGTAYRVTDLFVEQATHEEYKFALIKSVVRDSAWRLVIGVSPAPADANFAGQLLKGFGADSAAEVQERKSEDGRRAIFIANVHRPFPDSIRFRVDTVAPPATPP